VTVMALGHVISGDVGKIVEVFSILTGTKYVTDVVFADHVLQGSSVTIIMMLCCRIKILTFIKHVLRLKIKTSTQPRGDSLRE